MGTAYRPPPFPTTPSVTGPQLGAAGTVLTRRMNTALRQPAGVAANAVTFTADASIPSTAYLCWGDTTAAGVTLTLPSVSEYQSNLFIVERIAGANTLTLAARGADTIDGAASITVTTPIQITPSDNATWHVAFKSA